MRDGQQLTVTVLAAAEPLRPPPPAPYPAQLGRAAAGVGAQALVAFRGNQYSVPPACRAAAWWLIRLVAATARSAMIE
ncbi:hypothetical protein ACPPVO_24020 [Dactylosporangium sp. McL0621]|uniref:hypothetical protein n=1 Tax=Dactylosporangium sp. McL0621 TaxID=3415678 RepID=UPI003CEC438B